jgi:hypothetical protein
MVFLNAAIKKVSFHSLVKLLMPAHWIGLLPSHFMKARAKAKIMGIKVNTQKPIKLGAIKE